MGHSSADVILTERVLDEQVLVDEKIERIEAADAATGFGENRLDLRTDRLDDRQHALLLRAEVVRHQPTAHTGVLTDLRQRRTGVTLLTEQIDGRIHQPLPGFGRPLDLLAAARCIGMGGAGRLCGHVGKCMCAGAPARKDVTTLRPARSLWPTRST